MAAFGIDVTNEDTQKLFEQFKNIPKDKQHEIMHQMMARYIDFEKVYSNMNKIRIEIITHK